MTMTEKRNQSTNPVKLPSVDARNSDGNPNRSAIIDSLYKIETVKMTVVWDDENEPITELETDSSARVLETMAKANLNRATITELVIAGVACPPRSLAKLNHFVHVPGLSKGFRGWKIRNSKGNSGVVLWRSSGAWIELKGLMGISK